MTYRVVICRSNPIAPDTRVEKEALTLSQSGYNVTLVGWDRESKLSYENLVQGIRYFRLNIPVKDAEGINNLSSILRWQIGLFKWLVTHTHEYDVIHACDFDTILPALLSSKIFRKKVIYDIFDFYADMLRKTPKLIINIIHRMDIWAINQADGVILADHSRNEQIAGSQPKRSIIIYNSPRDLMCSINYQAISPVGRLKLSYIGLLQYERGIFDLIEVLSKHVQWELELGGYGPEEEKIRDKVEGISNIHWHGRIPHHRALELNSASDVMIAIFDPSIPNNRYASSNKLFEAMMLNKPIIVARNTNMDRIVQEHECGIIMDYGDQSGLEEALQDLAQDPDQRQRLGENGRISYEQLFNWEVMEIRLKNFYSEILRD
jgi:glycosyltransferase involved in cell wall biosynthesis